MNNKVPRIINEFCDMTLIERYVFTELLRIEDHQTHEFFYKQSTIAKRLCLSLSTVARTFKLFKDTGLLKVRKRRRRSNIYVILKRFDEKKKENNDHE